MLDIPIASELQTSLSNHAHKEADFVHSGSQENSIASEHRGRLCTVSSMQVQWQ